MATKSMSTRKKSTTSKQEKEQPINEVVIEEPVEDVKKTKKRTFSPDDPIPCKSITLGGLYYEGKKSHILYEWVTDGIVTEVEYQDLVAAVRSHDKEVFAPRFIIEDEDFLAQNPRVAQVYDSMYSIQDLREIFDYPVNAMASVINKLPNGAKESVKHMASEMIMSGQLDSVSRIKTLDEIYGTQLILMAVES